VIIVRIVVCVFSPNAIIIVSHACVVPLSMNLYIIILVKCHVHQACCA